MLAPLTNLQSHADGRISDDEHNWLTYRASGGFGLVMTCAAHVQRIGQGFPGQLGIFGEQHIASHQGIAEVLPAAEINTADVIRTPLLSSNRQIHGRNQIARFHSARIQLG